MTASNDWTPSLRYPDPAIRSLDPRFDKYRVMLTNVERLATGTLWGEGPVYFGDQRCVLWSDIPNNRILRWDEETGAVTVFRKPSNRANGNTRDRQGRLVTCEHGRRVTRTEYDGAITVIADNFGGKRLNSPNDVVVKSDDSIWFTDPQFGILSNYEGEIAEPELPMNVYRVDGKTGAMTVVADHIIAPNGLAFSPDEKKLYVVESRAVPRRILAFDITGDGIKIGNRQNPDRCRPGRHARRLPRRYRRQSLVRLGHVAGARRRARVLSRRRADRTYLAAGALRQCLFRRAASQPAVHGGGAFALFALHQRAGRAGRLINSYLTTTVLKRRRIMAIQRLDTGPRMSKAVVHGDTVYLAGLTADKAKGKASPSRPRKSCR